MEDSIKKATFNMISESYVEKCKVDGGDKYKCVSLELT